MSEVETTPESGVKVEKETLPGSRVQLSIEIPAVQVDKAFERTLQRLSQRVRIQGFRPGKAPRALVEARIGPQGLREEVADLLVGDVVNGAILESQVEPIDRPQVDVEVLQRGEPGRFKARVSVMPEVKLPDVGTLHVDPVHTEITDVDVERQLERRLDEQTEVEPVEREVRVGDQVVGDLSVTVDGEEVPSEARTAMELDVREGVLVPELFAAVQGAKEGDEVTAEVTLPEQHSDPDLRGKQATLTIKVQGVKEKHVPELTDELASEITNGEQKTAAELRETIRQELVETAERSDRVANEQSAVEAYVEAAEVDVPDALIDHEIDHQLGHLEENLQQSGLKLDRYFEYLGRSEQAYRAELRPQAEGRIRTDLVLAAAEKQQLVEEPADDEVKDYIREQAKSEPSIEEDLDKFLTEQTSLDFFRQRLTRQRIVERITELVAGEPPVRAAEAQDDDVERIEAEIPDEAGPAQDSGESGGAVDAQ